MKKKELKYKPSLTARIAKIILPKLYKNLPRHLYIFLYQKLYFFYKVSERYSYFAKTFIIYQICSKNIKLKRKLVFDLLPFTMGGPKALENAYELTRFVEDNNISGDIVECGVAQGGTASMMALVNKQFGKYERKKWFFDSFEGLPDPTKEDYLNGKTGDYIRPLPKGSCLGTLNEVSNLMFNYLNLNIKTTFLIKGWFQNTINVYKKNISEIAILRLDGDWYESTKIPLEAFYDCVNEKGFIIIDDYLTCYGSRKAVDEFRKKRKINSKINLDGRGGIWFQKI